MKKFLVCLLTVMTFSVFAAVSSPWLVTTDEEAAQFTTGRNKEIAQMTLALVKGNYNTYAELKAAVENYKLNWNIVSICSAVPMYHKFRKDVVEDKSIPDLSKMQVNVAYIEFLSDQEILDNAVEIIKKGYSSNSTNILLNRISKIDSVEDAKILAVLKKIKRVIYPKISESDDWKKVNVKLELMIKSFE